MWTASRDNMALAVGGRVIPFPDDPQRDARRRAADRAIVDALGPALAIQSARNADQVANRAQMMLATRDRHGRYVFTPAEVMRELESWHAAHGYPELRAVTHV